MQEKKSSFQKKIAYSAANHANDRTSNMPNSPAVMPVLMDADVQVNASNAIDHATDHSSEQAMPQQFTHSLADGFNSKAFQDSNAGAQNAQMPDEEENWEDELSHFNLPLVPLFRRKGMDVHTLNYEAEHCVPSQSHSTQYPSPAFCSTPLRAL